jgi:hypothetical protein
VSLTKTVVATWSFTSNQKEHSHCVSWCYIQLLRAEYIKTLEKMAIVTGLLQCPFCLYLSLIVENARVNIDRCREIYEKINFVVVLQVST